MTNQPTVTIVICARNAATHLKTSIPSALAQDYPRGRLKILVVDNASTDETACVAKSFGIVVRCCTKPGVANAREFAWRVAKSELIAFLDADCEAPENWISSLVSDFHANEKLGAVGIRLVGDRPRTIAEEHIERSHVLDTDRFFQRNALQFPFVVTAGMIVRRDSLASVNGFDTTLGRDTGEDADLCWRLTRNGWTVAYRRDVAVLHHHRSTVRAMLRQVHWYGRASAALFARWHKELGWPRYTDWSPYRRFATGILQTLPALVFKTGYERYAPMLRAFDAVAFLLGKWIVAAKERVLFL